MICSCAFAAGFLGIKYLLAAKPEMLDSILPQIMDPAIHALQGGDDDVKGAVAEALLPGVQQLLSLPHVCSLDFLGLPLKC